MFRTLAFTDSLKTETWRCYYERQLNRESEWEEEERLTNVNPNEGLPVQFESILVEKAI